MAVPCIRSRMLVYWMVLLYALQGVLVTSHECSTTNCDTGNTSPHLFHALTYNAFVSQGFWFRYNVSSPRLNILLSALSPTKLRIGGSETEYLTFVTNSSVCASGNFSLESYNSIGDEMYGRHEFSPINLTECDILNVLQMCSNHNISLLLDVNGNERDRSDKWDPTNFVRLLDFLKTKLDRLSIPALDFQLGNEPNAYKRVIHRSISPAQLANDYQFLRQVLDHHGFKHSKLYGPEITSPKNLPRQFMNLDVKPQSYLRKFFNAGGQSSLDFITMHQYYLDGKTAKPSDCIDPQVLDYFGKQLQQILLIMRAHNVTQPLALTETGSTWGGRKKGDSDKFVDGFLLMDKMGMSGIHNISAIFRQCIFHGDRSLIDSNLNPKVDYWISVLYHKLVKPRGRVYMALPACTGCNNGTRVYLVDGYDGTLVIMAMNLNDHSNSITLEGCVPSFQGYVFTGHSGLTSSLVRMNGRTLKFPAEASSLPPLNPVSSQAIDLPPYSYSFFVTKKTSSFAG